MVNIVLADDSDLMLIGAQSVLTQQADFQVIGTCQTLTDLLELSDQSQPDVIILGDRIEPDINVLRIVECVQAVTPHVQIIVLGRLPEGLIIHELIQCGVVGYLYKYDRLEDCLSEAVRSAMRGKPYLSPSASTEYLLATNGDSPALQIGTEGHSILCLLADGNHPKAIALALNMPVSYIYRRIAKLRRRFDANTNEHLIAQAAKEGFLP